MDKVKCIKPFAGPFPISSPFGERVDPKSGVKKMHNGVDFACPEGTPIRAILDGKIFASGWENEADHEQGYGKRIWQECHLDKETVLVVYAHLSQRNKEVGEWADQSSIIGLSGATGKATYPDKKTGINRPHPHLHLGARVKDTNHFLNFEFEENDNDAPVV